MSSESTDVYQRRSITPQYFHNKSGDQRHAAEILRSARQVPGDPYDLLSIEFMLYGLSLELMFKAILLQQEHSFPRNHKLEALARRAGFSWRDSDRRILRLLGHYIIWSGRYPTPNDKSEYKELGQLVSDVSERNKLGSMLTLRFDPEVVTNTYHELWRTANIVYLSNC